MGVTDFDTKAAVVLRDDLAAWQRLNVAAFLMSGVTAHAGPGVVGSDYVDADGVHYLPMLRQPVLVFEASGAKLKTVHERALRRGVQIAILTPRRSARSWTVFSFAPLASKTSTGWRSMGR